MKEDNFDEKRESLNNLEIEDNKKMLIIILFADILLFSFIYMRIGKNFTFQKFLKTFEK
jgi:hypothetical protein